MVLWNTYSPKDGETLQLQVGRRELWIWRSTRSWAIAHRVGQDVFPATVQSHPGKPENEHWQSFFTRKRSQVVLQPAVPDRPLMLKSEKDRKSVV